MWVEVEKRLEALERFESLNREEQAEVLSGLLTDMLSAMSREQMQRFFKLWILSNPDLLEELLDKFKTDLLKQYREAIKQAKREAKIKRR